MTPANAGLPTSPTRAPPEAETCVRRRKGRPRPPEPEACSMSCAACGPGRGARRGRSWAVPCGPPPCATPRVRQGRAHASACGCGSPAARRPAQAAPAAPRPGRSAALLAGRDPPQRFLRAVGGHAGAQQARALVPEPTQPCVRRVWGRWLQAGGRPAAHWVVRRVCPCPTSAQNRWVAQVPEMGSSCGPITTPQPEASGERGWAPGPSRAGLCLSMAWPCLGPGGAGPG